MSTSLNSINDVPRTPTSQAGTVQFRTNAKENKSTPAKYHRRRFGPEEREEVARKRRDGACALCRKKKIKCLHDSVSVFQDQESDLLIRKELKELNTKCKAALGIKDENRRIQTNNTGWKVTTPQDYAQTPSEKGSEVSRGKGNVPLDSEKGQFELPFSPGPQTSQADRGIYHTFGCLPQSSESRTGSEDTSTQPLAASFFDDQQTWNILSQAPDQSSRSISNPSERSPPNDTNPQTPSRRIEIPSLDFTSSTVESQGQASSTPHGLTDTPTRTRTGEQQGLAILGNGLEPLYEVDSLKGAGEIGEMWEGESFEHYLMRDICEHPVYSETSV